MSQAKLLILSSPYKLQIIFLSLGIILVILGLILRGNNHSTSNQSQEVLGNSTVENSPESSASLKIEIDVSGEVVNPGVYELDFGSRVEDALQKAGGITDNADKNWVDKNINKAAKLTDGQKIYIPSLQQSNNDIASSNEQNSSVAQSESGQININTASLGELESLEGIGQVYGQKIIDNRPYSAVEELLSKSVLKQSEYNKIKDRLIVY